MYVCKYLFHKELYKNLVNFRAVESSKLVDLKKTEKRVFCLGGAKTFSEAAAD